MKVTAAIWIENDKVFIAKRPAGDTLQDKWEFPGGKIESGETPEMCLSREMSEEFGVSVDVNGFFGRSIYRYDSGSIELLAYFITCHTGKPEANAHDEIRWVRAEELMRYDFAPADIPLVKKLQDYMQNTR